MIVPLVSPCAGSRLCRRVTRAISTLFRINLPPRVRLAGIDRCRMQRSGLGVSVLLRQADGFEGFEWSQKNSATRIFPLRIVMMPVASAPAQGPGPCRARSSSRRLGPRRRCNPRESPLRRSSHVSRMRSNWPMTVSRPRWASSGQPSEARTTSSASVARRASVAAFHAAIPPHNLHVLLRHRPRSIPQLEEFGVQRLLGQAQAWRASLVT